MKTSILIVIIFLQVQFASALNDSLKTDDSLSSDKCLVVLLDGTEYYGELQSQKDSIYYFKNNLNILVKLPINHISCIIHLVGNYNPNIENESNKNFMFFMEDKTVKYGTIISDDGFYESIKLDDDSIAKINNAYYKFKIPYYLFKSIEYFNDFSGKFSRIFLKDGWLDGLILLKMTDKILFLNKSNYLLTLTDDYIFADIQLIKISDTSSLSAKGYIIDLDNGQQISGDIISETKDSIQIKLEPGISASLSKNNINRIDSNNLLYDSGYFSKNNIYLDGGSFLSYYYNINYERLITENISLRIGYGHGKFYASLGGGGGKEGDNLNLLCNFLLFKGNSKLELGIGASYILNLKYHSVPSEKVYYAFSFGYRYQPKNGGLLFKAGYSLFYPGFGLNISLGYSF